MDFATMKLPAEQRSALRSAIKNHAGWSDYRARWSLDLSTMGKDNLLAAAHALGIDLAPFTGASATNNENNQGSDDMNAYTATPKPKTVGPAAVGIMVDLHARHRLHLSTDDAVKCAAILGTIQTKQDGWATERQFEYLQRTLKAAQAIGMNMSAAQDAPKLVLPLPTPVSAPVAPVSNDPASQLAALISQMAGNAINPEQVARIVDERINAALANIPTIKVECQSPRAIVVSEGRHHPAFVKILKAASARQSDGFAPNLWLAGPTASGKTHIARSVAKAMSLDFGTHGSMMMSFELMGFVDAGGRYHSTPFRRIFENGGVVLLDELDAWDPPATLALNAALANGAATFPDGLEVKRHPDCIIMGAGNTWGAGATAEFVGRAKLDAAFLSRFPVRFALDYDPELEQHISGNAQWAMHVQSARAKARSAGLKVIIDPRVSIAGAALVAAGFSIREAAEQTYLANLSADQRKQMGE